MTPEVVMLIDGYFDDTLTESEQSALRKWLMADPEHARAFARSAILHDQLRNALAGDVDLAEVTHLEALGQRKPATDWLRKPSVPTRVWSTVATLAVLLVGSAFLWLSPGPSAASAAFRDLDRIIANNIQSKDRTYRIVVEDVVTPARQGKRPPEVHRPPKPPLDGAILHLREGRQFVLIRHTSDGLPFITGCDGQQSWAVNTRGPVKISADPRHFDHDLPGHETSIPLANLQGGLEGLKQSYDLQFSTLGPEEYEARKGEDPRLLMAVKKSKVRGPQRVEIAYDSKSGRILGMRFVQMPYGPDRLDLRLSLVDENDLPVSFFEHSSHHAPDRRVEEEN